MGIFIEDDNDHEFDVGKRLEADLQSVITAEINEEKQAQTGTRKVPIAEELRKQKILATESGRIQSRVLFITTDTSVRETGSVQQQSLQALEEVFDEVHILLLVNARAAYPPANRLSKRVWLYEASSPYLFYRPFAALRAVKDQLVFTDGFRPDVVVALEPFVAGVTAHLVAKKYDRPWQVHITSEKYLYEDEFKSADKNNRWRLHMMEYVLKRVSSVQVSTTAIQADVQAQFPKIKDVAVLPKFFNLSALLQAPPPTTPVFPQFKFTIAYKGNLDADSTFYRALDAARSLLMTPSIGMVVIGRGASKQRFMERAKILGVASQIVWLGEVEDDTKSLQGANVMLVTDTDDKGDEIAIKAAALGVPLIMSTTELRADLFESGRDAYLLEPEDTKGFAQALTSFINTNSLRTQFKENGRQIVKSRVEEDPRLYRLAYRNAIEKVLYLEEAANVQQKNATVIKQAHSEAAERSKQFTTVDGIEMKLPQRRAE